ARCAGWRATAGPDALAAGETRRRRPRRAVHFGIRQPDERSAAAPCVRRLCRAGGALPVWRGGWQQLAPGRRAAAAAHAAGSRRGRGGGDRSIRTARIVAPAIHLRADLSAFPHGLLRGASRQWPPRSGRCQCRPPGVGSDAHSGGRSGAVAWQCRESASASAGGCARSRGNPRGCPYRGAIRHPAEQPVVVRYFPVADPRTGRIADRQWVSGHSSGRAMSAIEELRSYVSRLQRRFQLAALARGSAIVTAIALIATLLLTVIINRFAFSTLSLWSARAVLLLVLMLGTVFGLAIPLWRLGRRWWTRRAERAFPQFEQRLVTFAERDGQGKDPFLELLAADTLRVARATDLKSETPDAALVALFAIGVVSLGALLWLIRAG